MSATIKKIFIRIKDQKLRYNFLQAFPFWIASVITGLLAVGYAKIFALTEVASRYLVTYYGAWLLLLSPLCFSLAFFVVHQFSPYARGSGIPQVMAALEMPANTSKSTLDKLMGIRVIIVKILSSLLMVLGGAAIGREGPTIQIAGSVFRKINQWIPESWPKVSRKTMIMTGAAAGLAAAFNTPLGGIVFAVEELTSTHIKFYRTAIFSAVIISGLTAQGLLGSYLYLGYPNVASAGIYIFGGIVVVAATTGLCGSYMCRIILRLFAWKKGFALWQQYMYVVVCAVLMAAAALFINKEILWSGKEVMSQLLFTADKQQSWYVPFLRIVGPILSFTTDASGGIFAPALSAGASIGALFSQWFQMAPANANLLILAGMVGFLTGVTRSPFTSAILVLEMTDQHSVIFYLMLAAMVASLFSLLVDKHSFYDHLKHQYLDDIKKEEVGVEMKKTTE